MCYLFGDVNAVTLYSAMDFEILLQLRPQQWSHYCGRYWILDSRGLLDRTYSSGAIAFILLVSSRLDCLAEVCATCLEMSMWSFSGGVALMCCSSKLFFYQLKKITKNIKLRCYRIIFMSKKILISCSTKVKSQNFNIHH